ncbi:MAG: hypothetical protein LBF15_00270 [Candidatus Peribacteria bacterium]|jgi:hypothetical protein|nr:hypothetical protein [Candidatus Peribacteria bacterium]
MLLEEKPKYIHIVYEGPIGWAGVLLCNRYNLKYTTSFHSKYPEYFNLRTGFSTAY